MSRTGAGREHGRSALLFQRTGEGTGKIRIATGQDEPVPGSVPGFRHQGLAPDHVIAQVGMLPLPGLEQFQRLLVGTAHGKVDDFANGLAFGGEDGETGREHLLPEAVAFLHDGPAPDRFGRTPVEDDFFHAERHETVAREVILGGGKSGDHALQATVEQGRVDDETAFFAAFGAVQGHFGHCSAPGAPQAPQAAEGRTVLHGPVGIEFFGKGLYVHLVATFTQAVQVDVFGRALVGGGELAGDMLVPFPLSLPGAPAEDLEIGPVFRGRDKDLYGAFAFVEHEGLAQHHILEPDTVRTEMIHARGGGQVEMRRARNDHDVENAVLGQEGLQGTAHCRRILAHGQGGGEAPSQQDMARVVSVRCVRPGGRDPGTEGLAAAVAVAGDDDMFVKVAVGGGRVAGRPVESFRVQQAGPALGGQEGIVAAQFPVTQFVEQAAEGYLEAHGRPGQGDFPQEEQAVRGQHGADVAQGGGQVGSGVQDIGADDDIELVGMEALKERVAADVQRGIFHEGEGGEAVPGPGREQGGDVRIDITGASCGQDGQQGRGRPARAGADLQDGEGAVHGQGIGKGLQAPGHDPVIITALRGILVDALHGVRIAAGEHDLSGILAASQYLAEILAAAFHEREQRDVVQDKVLTFFMASLWHGHFSMFPMIDGQRGRRPPAGRAGWSHDP